MMVSNIFKLEFRGLFKGLLLWTVAVSLLLILFMSFFPSMQSETMKQLVGVKLDAMSPAVLKAFGLATIPDFTKIMGYFTYTIQYINLAVVIYAMMLGAGTLIREESEGTIEYLYAQPVKRSSIIWGKLGANLLAFLTLVGSLFGVTAALFAVLREEGSSFNELIMNLVNIYLGLLVAGVIFLALGFLVSVFLRNSKQAGAVALGIVFLTFILGSLSSISSNFKFLEYFSPLTILGPNNILEGELAMAPLLGFGVVGVLSLVLTFVFYQKKDLKI